VSKLLTVPPYLAVLWQLMKRLPQGEWTLELPLESQSRRNQVLVNGAPILRIKNLLEKGQSEALLPFILGMKNALPAIVMDMAKHIAMGKVLAIVKEITEEYHGSTLSDVELAAFLAESLEAFKRAESVVPRERGERPIDWIERVIYKLQILDGFEKGNF
jgi:hypothetical protein